MSLRFGCVASYVVSIMLLVMLHSGNAVGASTQTQQLEATSLVLQWLPQAQFAGYYMALDKGFYKDAGIDLTLISGGPDILSSEYLKTGKADFATMFLSTGLQRRAEMPLVNVGQFVQHSALMLVAKKSSGISTIKDLDGKNVGLWANEFEIQARALFRQHNISVHVIPQSNSMDLFMRDGVAAASVMWYNEYHTLYTYGVEFDELQPFFFKNSAWDFPEDGIYCLKQTADAKPELVKNLVAATAKGWRYAFEHPDEAIDAVMRRMKEAGVPSNKPHQMWMLQRMQDVMGSLDEQNLGVLKKSTYRRVKNILWDNGAIITAPRYHEFYRGRQ